MGGRGGSSGMSAGGASNATDYAYLESANKALGFGNGGETDKWMAGLSGDESSAFKYYTRRGYSKINNSLRRDKEIDPNSPLGKKINAMDNAINRYDLKEPIVFHRAIDGKMLGLKKPDMEKLFYGGDNRDALKVIQSKVGQVVYDKGYASSSAARDASWGSFNPIMCHIKTPAGKGIGAYLSGLSSYGSRESEFLFGRRSGFKITGASVKNGVIDVGMQYIGRA